MEPPDRTVSTSEADELAVRPGLQQPKGYGSEKEIEMKQLLIALTLVAVAAPALAANPFYVMFNKTTKSCFISRSAPTETEKFSMMGVYGSAYMAKMAMHGMMACR
jgi:hypothetical protein